MKNKLYATIRKLALVSLLMFYLVCDTLYLFISSDKKSDNFGLAMLFMAFVMLATFKLVELISKYICDLIMLFREDRPNDGIEEKEGNPEDD